VLDANRLFLVIGDVSGKGPRAAEFKDAVSRHVASGLNASPDVGTLLSQVNRGIAHDNREDLFATLFAAHFDARTGELAFANAGHEPPYVRAPGGKPERLPIIGGPALGALRDFAYQAGSCRLAAGGWICAFTDGITEAMNARREFLGATRWRAMLERLEEEADAESIVRTLRAGVEAFEAGAERADDQALLVLRWRG
jgi:serine phosphatase RsbU (regulator of sigma subunit)